MSWLEAFVVGVVVVLCSWVVLVVAAARLPNGVLKELAGFLPNCVQLMRRLRSHEAVPLNAKLAVGFAALWVLSPIDLIPEFLPVIGPLDDILVVAVVLRYAARQIPRDVLLDSWDGDPDLMQRLLGRQRESC